MSLLIALCFSLIVPVLVSAATLERNRLAWEPRYVREELVHTAGAGAFRQTEVREGKWSMVGRGLPTSVFLAAFTALFVGQMFVPTAPAALMGLIFGGDGQQQGGAAWWMIVLSLSWFPGTFCAVHTFRTGLALLRGNRVEAERMVRRNTRLTLGYNALLCSLAIAAIVQRTKGHDFASVTIVYAAAVVMQALFTHGAFALNRSKFLADDPDAKLGLPSPSPATFGDDFSVASAERASRAAP